MLIEQIAEFPQREAGAFEADDGVQNTMRCENVDRVLRKRLDATKAVVQSLRACNRCRKVVNVLVKTNLAVALVLKASSMNRI